MELLQKKLGRLLNTGVKTFIIHHLYGHTQYINKLHVSAIEKKTELIEKNKPDGDFFNHCEMLEKL